eukprot:COSAG01_NODE_1208_length_11239_cov_36.000987_6_plen_79_part_00
MAALRTRESLNSGQDQVRQSRRVLSSASQRSVTVRAHLRTYVDPYLRTASERRQARLMNTLIPTSEPDGLIITHTSGI